MELTDQVRREIGQVSSILSCPSPACLLTTTVCSSTKHFVVGFFGYDVNADIEALIRDYYVGYVSRYLRLFVASNRLSASQKRYHPEAQRPKYAYHLTLVMRGAGPSSAYTPRREANPFAFAKVTTDS